MRRLKATFTLPAATVQHIFDRDPDLTSIWPGMEIIPGPDYGLFGSDTCHVSGEAQGVMTVIGLVAGHGYDTLVSVETQTL